MLSEKELIDGQRWLACWEKVTSKPMTSRETLFASAIESAACAERDARIAHLEATASANYKRGYDDAHSMLVERIAELEQELEKVRQQMEAQKDEWLSWEAKRKTLEMDAERLDFITSACEVFLDGVEIGSTDELDAAMKGTP